MFKKILVPLDGSPRAEAVLPTVEGLADCLKSSIVLMQVVELSGLFVGIPSYLGTPDLTMDSYLEIKKSTQEYLESVQARLQAKGLQVDIVVAEGTVVNQIISVAQRVKADLIAMASHGRTGLERSFYGSVAAGIINRVDRPLLLVRAETVH